MRDPKETTGQRRSRQPGSGVRLAQAHQRLQYLYEISKLLTRFESVDESVLAVMAAITPTLPLQNAILILETPSRPRALIWEAEGLPPTRLRDAKAHARAAYGLLVGEERARSIEFPGEQPGGPPPKKRHEHFIALPLAVDHEPIFGALQLESSLRLTELDLIFVNAVVNQLAIALDRKARVDLLQAQTEERRSEAVRGQAIAEELTQRLQLLLDNLDHAFVWEAEAGMHKVSFVSARAEAILGHPLERWRADPELWLRCVHPEDREELERFFERALHCEEDLRIDHRAVTATGQVLWLHTGVHVVRQPPGPARLQGVSVDISPTKQEEQRVRDQLDFTRSITGSLGEGVLAVDPAQRVTFFNPSAEGLLGWTEGEVLGREVQEVLRLSHPDGKPLRPGEDPVSQVLRTQAPTRSDEHLLSGRGAQAASFPVSYTCVPLRLGRAYAGAVFVFQDLTGPRRVEKAQRFLAETSAVLASSLDYRETLAAVVRLSVPLIADVCFIDELAEDGTTHRIEVAVADPTKQHLSERVLRVAPALRAQTPQSRVLGSGRPVLLPELDSEGAASDEEAAELLRALELRSLLAVPLEARGRTFGVLTFATAGSRRRYTPADVDFAADIGRRAAMAIDNARLYRQAQRASRAREDVLAVVSHDLRNPLSLIQMTADLALRTLPTGQEGQRKKLSTIHTATLRMARLISDLLDVASIDSGRLSLQRGRQGVSGLVEAAVEAQRELATQKTLRLTGEAPLAELEVLCDPHRTLQVFSNLIGNAIKFTPAGGAILIRAEPRDQEVLFVVADSGPGIPVEQLAHVFDRYWQGGPGGRGGVGLGLSISKGIVEASGGRIWAESEVGRGSSFFFTLPRVQGHAAQTIGVSPASELEHGSH